MRGIDVQERPPDIPGEGEIGLGVAGEMVVEENAARPARLAAGAAGRNTGRTTP